MNIRNQICTFQQAKRLKELGVIQESEFVYFIDEYHLVRRNRNYDLSEIDYCAFTVAELGVMLPEMFASRFGAGAWICYNDKGESEQYPENFCDVISNTEAEARSAMLIHLLETKAITAEEVNQRLINS